MDFSKLLHVFVKIDTWISSCYGFVKVATWICQSCSMYFCRLQNETKFDQDFKTWLDFCFEVKVLIESKYSNFNFSLQDSRRDGTEKSLLGVRVRN